MILPGSRVLRRLAITLCLSVATVAAHAEGPTDAVVLSTYADLALAGYEDSLSTAKALDSAIEALIATPSAETLEAAKAAWKA
ncbi:MAG: peptidase, partial [Alphaproteobacteria bacterium]|nr:peptidase [Alphaproteobacteria bacterium]